MGYEFWVAILGIIGTVFKSIKFVQEGELGIRLRFGRAQKNKKGEPVTVKPGFVFMIPFIETLKRHHVRQQTLKLDDQKVMIKRGLIFNVSAIVIFRVKDIYRALFEIDDLDNSLNDLSMGILRDVLANKEFSQLAEMDKISDELLRELKEKAEEWGVNFIQFKLTNCAPTSETAPLVNAEAGVELKIEALTKACEKFGKKITDLSPILAAALVGIPLVAAVTEEIHFDKFIEKKEKVSLSLLEDR